MWIDVCRLTYKLFGPLYPTEKLLEEKRDKKFNEGSLCVKKKKKKDENERYRKDYKMRGK